MTETEVRLLVNVLNALDRLFDSESSVVELHDLLFATSLAMTETQWFAELNRATEALAPLLALRESDARDRALVITDDLRILIATSTRGLCGNP